MAQERIQCLPTLLSVQIQSSEAEMCKESYKPYINLKTIHNGSFRPKANPAYNYVVSVVISMLCGL